MKLHELLPIEANLETQAHKVRTDLATTFEKKRHLFEEKRLNFTPNEEGARMVTEQQSDLQTTVIKELQWITKHIGKFWDASLRVAQANRTASADIILENGTIIASKVPATFLLELQKRLSEVQSLAAAIPTLDPAKGFQPDSARGEYVYAARAITKKRTTKQPQVIVKYDAVVKDGVGIPAQTELYSADVVVGIIEEQEWSGMVTPAHKSEILDRIEELTRAVKSARSRANEETVGVDVISYDLLSYIFG